MFLAQTIATTYCLDHPTAFLCFHDKFRIQLTDKAIDRQSSSAGHGLPAARRTEYACARAHFKALTSEIHTIFPSPFISVRRLHLSDRLLKIGITMAPIMTQAKFQTFFFSFYRQAVELSAFLSTSQPPLRYTSMLLGRSAANMELHHSASFQ